MAFIIKFHSTGFTTQKYEEAFKLLIAKGKGAPAGRRCHICSTSPVGVNIVDVWNSKEEYQEFGETLIPILLSLGVEPGIPEIAEVHKMVLK